MKKSFGLESHDFPRLKALEEETSRAERLVAKGSKPLEIDALNKLMTLARQQVAVVRLQQHSWNSQLPDCRHPGRRSQGGAISVESRRSKSAAMPF